MARIVLLVVLMGLILMVSGCASHQAKPPAAVHHVVLLWYKDDVADVEARKIEAGSLGLAQIDGVRAVKVGKAIASERPVVDDSFDLAVLFEFDSIEDMHAYINNPVHKAFVESHIKGRMEKVLIYDF